jgi:lysophospholipase L1-like esterase
MENNGEKKKKLKGNRLLTAAALVAVVAALALAAKIFIDPENFHFSLMPSESSPSSSQASSQTSSPASSQASSQSSSVASSSANQQGYAYFDDAVFVGDSITAGIGMYKDIITPVLAANNSLTTLSAVNSRQLIGGKNQKVSEAVAAADPEKIYVLLGGNDLTWMSKSTYIDYYGQLIDILKNFDAKIYVQSIFPVTASYENSRSITNEKIDDFNAALKSLCESKGVTYLNVASALKGSDGKLPSSGGTSGYNISRASYNIWFEYLLNHK